MNQSWDPMWKTGQEPERGPQPGSLPRSQPTCPHAGIMALLVSLPSATVASIHMAKGLGF